MIWLVGSRGMLGQEVARRFDVMKLQHIDTDIECDITDLNAITEFGKGRQIRWIINCSAYTAVDKAESEEERARKINADGPSNLATFARIHGARIIHISTDYVFDGEAVRPYREDEPVNPTGAYGRTKAEGEQALAAATSDYFIIRTAWLYGTRGKNFVYTMLKLMNERDTLGVVADQHGTPTFAPHLAYVIGEIVRQDSKQYGYYHFTDSGETTWYDFARKIHEKGCNARRIERVCEIKPLRTEDYPTPARRPKYSVLAKDKIKSTFGIELSSWEQGLDEFFAEIGQEVSK